MSFSLRQTKHLKRFFLSFLWDFPCLVLSLPLKRQQGAESKINFSSLFPHFFVDVDSSSSCLLGCREKNERWKLHFARRFLPSPPSLMMMLIVWTFPNFSSFESLISTATVTRRCFLTLEICQERYAHTTAEKGKEKETSGEKYNFSAPFFPQPSSSLLAHRSAPT